jgi:hypothetical protein
MKCFFRIKTLGSLGVAVLALVATAVPAQAEIVSVDTSMCGTPELSQPFLFAKDLSLYTLVPGESYDNFEGEGWELSGGASVVSTTLADGSEGQVLDLPSGSQAVSPTLCVTSAYPTARTMVRNVKGSEGVFFYVSYAGTSTWETPKNTGQVHGAGSDWTLSSRVNMQPYKILGWQPVRITLIPGGKTSRFQVYNLYVDPRMGG